MSFDTEVKLAIYRQFADTGRRPSAVEVAELTGSTHKDVLAAFHRLCAQRVLVLEDEGESIRMAAPFSGIPTQHVVESEGTQYYANCAWDAFGIPAALQRSAVVSSRCEESKTPLIMEIGVDGPPPSDWLFHCPIPAVGWWEDVVFT